MAQYTIHSATLSLGLISNAYSEMLQLYDPQSSQTVDYKVVPCISETQPMDGVEEDPVHTAAPTADTFVHPDEIATQAYGATSDDDDGN